MNRGQWDVNDIAAVGISGDVELIGLKLHIETMRS